MKSAWRYWSTGGAAAVLAAANQGSGLPVATRASRVSRYTVEETARRLREKARERGLPVFATFRTAPPPGGPGAKAGPTPSATRPDALLLVLGTDESHTAVLQSTPGAPLDLPLTVRLESQGEETAVSFSDSDWISGFADLPVDVLDRVAALPELIDAAVR